MSSDDILQAYLQARRISFHSDQADLTGHLSSLNPQALAISSSLISSQFQRLNSALPPGDPLISLAASVIRPLLSEEDQRSFITIVPVLDDPSSFRFSSSQWSSIESVYLRHSPLLLPFISSAVSIINTHPGIAMSSSERVDLSDTLRAYRISKTSFGARAISGIVTERAMFAGMSDGSLRIWQTNRVESEWQPPPERCILMVAESPRSVSNRPLIYHIHSAPVYDIGQLNSQILISCDGAGAVRAWNVDSGQQLMQYDGHGMAPVWQLSIGGDYLATASLDQMARLFHPEHGKALRLFPHESSIDCLALSPNGSLLVCGAGEKKVEVWDVRAAQPIRVLSGLDSAPIKLGFIGEETVVAVTAHSTMFQWSLGRGELERESLPVLNGERCTALWTVGDVVAMGSMRGRIRFQKQRGGSRQFEYPGHAVLSFNRLQTANNDWTALFV